MLRIKNIILPVDHTDDDMTAAIASVLSLPAASIGSIAIVRRSVDARNRTVINYTYTVDVQIAPDARLPEKALKNPDVSSAPDTTYTFTVATPASNAARPVIIGAGPCGLFAALLLARNGFRPIILERGRTVRERMRDVSAFWRKGRLQPESNALFGEGGAGAFSDGKLNTQIKDRENRSRFILNELVAAGASNAILYESRPHMGSNVLIKVIENLRETITSLGGEIRYSSRVTGLNIESGRIRSVVVNDTEELPTENVLLAIGHSARDTYALLHQQGVALEQKAFSIGARIEHPQKLIDAAMYGIHATNPRLGAAEYKAVWHCGNGRSVYTFCMCPGGHVIAACSEPEMLSTNGMSYRARKAVNANSGLLVGVGPADYGDTHPLSGVEFQRRWERAAYRLGGGNYHAPVQLVRDLLAGRASMYLGSVTPSYTPCVTPSDLSHCLPEYVIKALQEAIPAIAQKIKGFDLPDAVLTGVETRSSSPVRICRDDSGQSISVKGLFPAGEGAGYAGGIMSAAMDGMKAAEQMAIRMAK